MEFRVAIKTQKRIPENCTSLKLENLDFKLFSQIFKQNSTIHTLDVSRNKFDDENILFLNLIISRIKKLEILILYDCALIPKQIQQILKNIPELKEIDFYFNYVRDEGCSYISDYLKRSDHLSLLDLSFCEINNLGIEYLTLGLSFHPSLKNLNLKGNLIISNGYISLFDCLKTMKSMKIIQLEDNGDLDFPVYESILSFLLENTPLEEININHKNENKNNALLIKGVTLNENILKIGNIHLKQIDPLDRAFERNLNLKEMKCRFNWKQVEKKLLDFNFK
jgi:Ran GTPase-activating protein (RanGAP) involved in mRNA processing and transport